MIFLHSDGKIDIYEVTSTSDLKRFISFPDRLYIGNPNYVPSLMMDEMENLRKAFEHILPEKSSFEL